MTFETPRVPTPAAVTPPPPRARRVLLGALLVVGIAFGMGAVVLGAFLVPMTDELGWQRSAFALVASIAFGLSAVLGLLIARSAHRVPPAAWLLFGAIALGGAGLAMSRVEEQWQFLLCGVALAFGLTALGSGVVDPALSLRASERRDRHAALAGLGVGLALGAGAPAAVFGAEELGWRDAWLAVAGVAFVLTILAALLLGRARPEQRPPLEPPTNEAGSVAWTGSTWLLVLVFGLALAALLSLTVHAAALLIDHDFTRQGVAIVLGAAGAAAFVAHLAWVGAASRVPSRSLIALAFILSAVAALVMLVGSREDESRLITGAFVLFGVGVGGQAALTHAVWRSVVGERHLAAARATVAPLALLLGAIGPYATGVVYDLTDTYRPALAAFAGAWIVGALLVLVARPATRPGAEPATGGLWRREHGDDASRHRVAVFGLPPESAAGVPRLTVEPPAAEAAPAPTAPSIPPPSAFPPLPIAASASAAVPALEPEPVRELPPEPPPVPPAREEPARAVEPEPVEPSPAPVVPARERVPAPVAAAARPISLPPPVTGAVFPPPSTPSPAPRFEAANGSAAPAVEWGRWPLSPSEEPPVATAKPEPPAPEPEVVAPPSIAVEPEPEATPEAVVEDAPVEVSEPPAPEPEAVETPSIEPEAEQVAPPPPPPPPSEPAVPPRPAPVTLQVRRPALPAVLADPGSLEVSLEDAARLLRRPAVSAGAAAVAVTVAWLVARRGGR